MKTCVRVIQGAMATFLILVCVGVWTAAAAAPAKAVVANLNDTLIATMKQAHKLGFAGRYKKLAPVIDHSFALPKIAQIALGPEWSKLNASQQKQYQAMFRKDTIATYADRFDGYDGQHFKITGVKGAPGGRKEVDTVIVDKDGNTIPINYILQNTGGRWQIVNVVAKGASDLALKRGQYTSVIQDKGAAGFIKQFRSQLNKYPELPSS